MNKHEEAREQLKLVRHGLNTFSVLSKYINEVEATEKEHKLTLQLLDKANRIIDETEKEHEELKRDVKRYFELNKPTFYLSYEERDELEKLINRLLKVGESE